MTIGKITESTLPKQPKEPGLDIIGMMSKNISSLLARVSDLETDEVDNVEIKATTGDPSGSWEGRRVINTFDNTYKIYADGAFRSIAVW